MSKWGRGEIHQKTVVANLNVFYCDLLGKTPETVNSPDRHCANQN
jgi:hypothetical protein